ncbi:MAG TPA: hypothetical protein VM934_15055 [Pyrinomonadaceae bacterium]|jgi:hypothetical protein|nr:hypothetical protein [Pyrinomonadaceae bacterium]
MTLEMSLPFKYVKIFVLTICITPLALPQTAKISTTDEDQTQKDFALKRISLISELQSLERETLRFGDPLSEALAKIEIADASWELDRMWSKKLIRAAYELTLHKAGQDGAQDRPAGSPPILYSGAERSRLKIRLRALDVARRDKDFVNELVRLEGESSGAYGKHFASAALADQALEAGDVRATTDYILQGIKADPTQSTAPDIINRIAIRDRQLADRLVIQYIEELRRFPISPRNQSDSRAFITLSNLVNASFIPDPSIRIPAPGPEVIRAYINYMLEALKNLEQQEPGYLQRRRRTLLSLWVPLQQYAPEMAAAFLNLESRSRRPGDTSALPTAASLEEEKRSQYERRIKDGLDGGSPHEGVIYAAISKGDFDKARKMIDKLADGARKNYLRETVNTEETISLATSGNIYVAEEMAKELRNVSSIQRVYPVLIAKSAVARDETRTTRLVYQALQQAKTSDTSPPSVPEGLPVSAISYDQRFDPRLSFISKLAADVLPIRDALAFEILDQLVSAANATPIETEQTRIGFDVSVFKKLASKNESHTLQAANSLRNPVQRVLSLAAIYQWKAKELTDKRPQP